MIKIYITDLAAYNNGLLVGEWVSLPIEEEILKEHIETVLKRGENISQDHSLHEEIFITDYEWEDIELFSINEYENIYTLNNQLAQLENLDEYQLKAVSFLLSQNLVNSVEEAIEQIDNVIIHEEQTLEDIAYNYINECYDLDKLPAIITTHIDYKAIARDLEIEGNYYEVNGDIYEYF